MNKQCLIDCGINYEDGLKRCLGKEDLYEEVLRAFIKDNILEKAKKAFEENDMESFRLYIHEIKGSSANIHFTEINESAVEINKMIHSENNKKEDLEPKFLEFEKKYNKIWDGIIKALDDGSL